MCVLTVCLLCFASLCFSDRADLDRRSVVTLNGVVRGLSLSHERVVSPDVSVRCLS
jgi:hypothetical protein